MVTKRIEVGSLVDYKIKSVSGALVFGSKLEVLFKDEDQYTCRNIVTGVVGGYDWEVLYPEPEIVDTDKLEGVLVSILNAKNIGLDFSLFMATVYQNVARFQLKNKHTEVLINIRMSVRASDNNSMIGAALSDSRNKSTLENMIKTQIWGILKDDPSFACYELVEDVVIL